LHPQWGLLPDGSSKNVLSYGFGQNPGSVQRERPLFGQYIPIGCIVYILKFPIFVFILFFAFSVSIIF
jgi:hypothetical protein